MPLSYPSIKTCDNPVFIVGAPRTSSSFWLTALVEAAGLRGSSEGHILALLSDLDHKVVSYYALLDKMGMLSIKQNTIARIPELAVRQALLDIFRNYYSMLYGEYRWVDKTVNAEMIIALPYLLTAWPNARIIYLKRSGFTNVQSALNYFKVGFEEACLNWARCGEVWESIRPLLPNDSILEIEHNELLTAPDKIALDVSKHLNLQSVAETKLIDYVVEAASTWRDKRGSGSLLAVSEWSHEQKIMFFRLCGSQMVTQGYLSKTELQALVEEYKERSVLEIDPMTAKVLQVDNPSYFQLKPDGINIIPGRNTAALVHFDKIRTAGMGHLEARLEVNHPESHGVRFELIGSCCNTGAIICNDRFELAALENRSVVLKINDNCDEFDLLIRVVRGSKALSNDYSHCRISEIRIAV